MRIFSETRRLAITSRLLRLLVSHDIGANPPQKAIEWSGFQGGSMAEPEYRLSVEQINDYTAE